MKYAVATYNSYNCENIIKVIEANSKIEAISIVSGLEDYDGDEPLDTIEKIIKAASEGDLFISVPLELKD